MYYSMCEVNLRFMDMFKEQSTFEWDLGGVGGMLSNSTISLNLLNADTPS